MPKIRAEDIQYKLEEIQTRTSQEGEGLTFIREGDFQKDQAGHEGP